VQQCARQQGAISKQKGNNMITFYILITIFVLGGLVLTAVFDLG
jgi:hypothetical protein